MTEAEYNRKLVELDRLLNDPAVLMDPGRVWSLSTALARHGAQDATKDDQSNETVGR